MNELHVPLHGVVVGCRLVGTGRLSFVSGVFLGSCVELGGDLFVIDDGGKEGEDKTERWMGMRQVNGGSQGPGQQTRQPQQACSELCIAAWTTIYGVFR